MPTNGVRRLTTSLLTVALIVGACATEPGVAPDPPDHIGAVAEVDSAETVDGGQFLGALEVTLADGTLLEVPRGVDYHGPRCTFVEEAGDYGAVREVADCILHVGTTEGVVDWIRGLRLEGDGTATPGFGTGDLIEVDVAERYVVTQWGGTLPWRGDPPIVDCDSSGDFEIDDPELLEHAAFHYRFDADGYLTQLTCGYEG